MEITVDEGGRKAVEGLVDYALKKGGLANLETAVKVLGSLKDAPGTKKPRRGRQGQAE